MRLQRGQAGATENIQRESGGMAATYLGVDVGTGSARAGVFDSKGTLLGQAVKEITIWRPQSEFVEQSSDDIWRAVCTCVQAAVRSAGIQPAEIRGIGFDATCSLVLIDKEGAPVTASPTGRDEQNVIVWMDHRAIGEAEEINSGSHEVLRYVGGRISPEMETPKLLWLKRNLPKSWERAAHFFDLPDFLTWRATQDTTRSLCSTVCKWTYLGHQEKGWSDDYFRTIGLSALVDEQYERIGNRVRPLGEPVGQGLTARAAEELGLKAGTPVSVSIIDAHAGGLGMIGAAIDGVAPSTADLNRRLALIGGTSSCHMAVSPEPRFVDGVWGPYYSAMVPGMWLTEGGQSATGSLVDLVVREMFGSSVLEAKAREHGLNVYEYLNRRLSELASDDSVAQLTHELHVCPYFHGNRSPRANAELRGMISGLRLSGDLDQHALVYLATIQAIALGTRHIIEVMNAKGYAIDTMIACGGGTKNPVFLQQHADATGCRIVLPREAEAVLLGSAMLGAAAAGDHPDLVAAMGAMSAAGSVIEPNTKLRGYFDAKFRVFHQLHDDQLRYAMLMSDA